MKPHARATTLVIGGLLIGIVAMALTLVFGREPRGGQVVGEGQASTETPPSLQTQPAAPQGNMDRVRVEVPEPSPLSTVVVRVRHVPTLEPAGAVSVSLEVDGENLSRKTGPEGTCEFAVPRGSSFLADCVRHPPVRGTASSEMVLVDLLLSEVVELHGVVLSSLELPIAAAEVVVQHEPVEPATPGNANHDLGGAAVTTDGVGRFSLKADLRDIVSAHHPQHGSSAGYRVSQAFRGHGVTPREIALWLPGHASRLRLRVTRFDGSAAIGAECTVVQRGYVYAPNDRPKEHSGPRVVHTDGQGIADCAGLLFGRTRVRIVDLADHVPYTVGVTLADQEEVPTDVLLPPTAIISGVVRREDGPAVASAVVSVLDCFGDVLVQATTNEQGFYELPSRPTLRLDEALYAYDMEVQHPERQTLRERVSVELVLGSNQVKWSPLIKDGLAIEGSVVYQGSDAKEFWVTCAGGGTDAMRMATVRNGRYVFSGLDSGEYNISLYAAGHGVPLVVHEDIRPPNDLLDIVDLTETLGANLSVSVVVPDKVEGSLRLWRVGTNYSTWRYLAEPGEQELSFSGLVAGSYVMSFQSQESEIQSSLSEITLQPGDNHVTANIFPPNTRRLYVTYVGPAGSDGLPLFLTLSDRNGRMLGRYYALGGRTFTTHLAAGKYTIAAEGQDGGLQTITSDVDVQFSDAWVRLYGGGAVRVNLELRGSMPGSAAQHREVEITVTDPRGATEFKQTFVEANSVIVVEVALPTGSHQVRVRVQEEDGVRADLIEDIEVIPGPDGRCDRTIRF